MYREKRSKRKVRQYKRTALLLSLMLIFTMAVVGTIAYLSTSSDPVTNTFVSSTVTTSVDETIDKDVKRNVSIVNTGDIDAYIRAKVIITWQDEAGNIYGQPPVQGTDYEIVYNLSNNGWVESSDGFYYWTEPVKPTEKTGILITSCKQTEVKEVGNTTYYLNVEIVGSGIQSQPTSVVTDVWSSGVSGVAGTTLQIIKGGMS